MFSYNKAENHLASKLYMHKKSKDSPNPIPLPSENAFMAYLDSWRCDFCRRKNRFDVLEEARNRLAEELSILNHVWDIRSSKYSVDLLFKDHLEELDQIESNAKHTFLPK